MGLRKLKEYRKAPQMRVLKYEPEEKTKFPLWMVVVLMIALLGSVLFIVNTSENADDETLEEFVEKARKDKAAKQKKLLLANVTTWQKDTILLLTGINVESFTWKIINYDIRHIFNKKAHGIVISDFNKIYSIINAPDGFQLAKKQRRDIKYLELYKNFDQKKLTCIIEIRTGKKELIV